MGLLPRLRERHAHILKHHSRTRLAASATVGELEAIVEAEVERVCNWPRTHHQPAVRTECNRLVEERVDTLIDAISRWAREGAYGLNLGAELAPDVRPALCRAELAVCSDALSIDADHRFVCGAGSICPAGAASE